MPTASEKTETKDCIDLHITLPCELADRVRGYAEKNDSSLANVLIEALDAFLRNRKNDGQ